MEWILDALVPIFAEPLAQLVKDKFASFLGVSGDIKELQDNHREICEVLEDAERRGINDSATNGCLKQLEDVKYDAEDILDLYRIEADKCSEGSSPTSLVSFPFSLFSGFRKPPVPRSIGRKIREINMKLMKISRRRSAFNFEHTSSNKQKVSSQISRRSSPLVEMDIVGSTIEEDTQNLVDLLIKDDTRGNFLVYAIVGVPGVGKTTLAQKIYNDQRIQDEFTVKKWVCVSQEFDEVNLLKDIIGDAHNDLASLQSRSLLETIVESIFTQQKLFLVLDDVWIANVWRNLLRNTLNNCAAGSRILVTTRNTEIARQMLAAYIHPVRELSLKDSWSLLCKKVFLTGEEGEIRLLRKIGMEIVKECDGLPLAVKADAGVLCTKEKTCRAWSGVLESFAWSPSRLPDGVKGALYSSYEDLPSHLKQCFKYFSLFPKDHRINGHTIPRLWIAEGFVKAEGSLTMEETAEEYFRQLIMRNLLQPCLDNDVEYQMNDLLHRLAWHLVPDESSVVTKVQEVGSNIGQMKLRRVYVRDKETKEIPDALAKHDSLRTLMWEECSLSETQMNVVFGKLSHLRVLDISFSAIQRLPDSLSNLIQLRYLNISDTKISEIPETIGNLRELLFLEIRNCASLSHLPKSVVTLHGLSSLDLYGTNVVRMPAGLGRLQNLRTLHGFKQLENVVEGLGTMEELRYLSCLTDLSIQNLECIPRGSEASAAELRNKSKLRAVRLHCMDNPPHTAEKIRTIKEVFEELHPPPCLEELQIMGYFGCEFPKWMKMAEISSSTSILFPNLRRLELHGCKYSDRLPPCGLLPSLDVLCIQDAGSILVVGHEFLVGTSSSGSGGGRAREDSTTYAFPRLQTLKFLNMRRWQEWHWDEGTQAMPHLKYLTLQGCPKLVSLPQGLLLQATSLTKLEISGANSLSTIEKLHSLKELYIKKNPKLAKVSNLPTLRTLKVVNCPGLQALKLQSLKRMKLYDNDMKSLPLHRPSKKRKVAHTAQLEKLNIWCNLELIRKISQNGSPEWQKIRDIQQVHMYSIDGSVYAFYDKSRFSFTQNYDNTSTSSDFKMSSGSSVIGL